MQGFQLIKIACTYDIEFTPQLLESFLIKRLCEYIGKLIVGIDIRKCDIPLGNMITDEVIPYLNMLGLAMENRIVSNLYSTFIVT